MSVDWGQMDFNVHSLAVPWVGTKLSFLCLSSPIRDSLSTSCVMELLLHTVECLGPLIPQFGRKTVRASGLCS